MKRIILVILFLSFFSFSSVSTSASGLSDKIQTLPFTESDITYTDVVAYYMPEYNYYFIYYFSAPIRDCIQEIEGYDYNYNCYARGDSNPSQIQMKDVKYLNSETPNITNGFFMNTSPQMVLATNQLSFDNVITTVDFLYRDLSLALAANYSPSVSLSISRSPEVGGGVSDYPAGENIYCGINGYNLCQAVFSLDTQVTLDAYPNEGYAFSHWEINDLAMADVDGTIVVPMSENKNVVAVFVPEFGFPLSGYTSTTVPISAVMDHSLTGGFYTADGRNNQVEAFNGLIANGTQHSYSGSVYCYDTTNTNPFPGLNYWYIYTDESRSEICYDEHPGFDFAVGNGTNVLAPFAGKLYWATTDLVNGNPGTFGTFYIDHENGYTSWFLHCSGLTQGVLDQIQQKGYADVSKGDHIAESGNQGSSAYHLHFEVRKGGVDDEHVIDPYGWELWEE